MNGIAMWIEWLFYESRAQLREQQGYKRSNMSNNSSNNRFNQRKEWRKQARNKEKQGETKRNKEKQRIRSLNFPFSIHCEKMSGNRKLTGYARLCDTKKWAHRPVGFWAGVFMAVTRQWLACGLPGEMFPVVYLHWSGWTAVTDDVCLRQSGEPANVAHTDHQFPAASYYGENGGKEKKYWFKWFT